MQLSFACYNPEGMLSDVYHVMSKFNQRSILILLVTKISDYVKTNKRHGLGKWRAWRGLNMN